jgi:translation initiation factor eIF-2B subunit epsilon
MLFEKAIFDHDDTHHDGKKNPTTDSNKGADADAIITKPDQVDLLLALQRAAAPRARGDSLLLFMAKALYDADVLEEDALMQWWRSAASAMDADMRRVRTRMQPFIDWLANAAEDDDDDDDDDDNDEEGDEDEGDDD